MKLTDEMIEELRLGAEGIRRWMPETLPADEQGQVHFARALAEAAAEAIEAILSALATSTAPVSVPAGWKPIREADREIVHQQHFPDIDLTIRNSDRYWVRDADGRVYEASWTEDGKGRDYWWDWEGESPVDPVEFMPHPLDPRFAAAPQPPMTEVEEAHSKTKSDLVKAVAALKDIKAAREYDAYWIAEAALVGLGVIKGDD